MESRNSTSSEIKPGWLRRELARAKREVRRWPEWKRKLVEQDNEFSLCIKRPRSSARKST